jgi:hypothetical protein
MKERKNKEYEELEKKLNLLYELRNAYEKINEGKLLKEIEKEISEIEKRKHKPFDKLN